MTQRPGYSTTGIFREDIVLSHATDMKEIHFRPPCRMGAIDAYNRFLSIVFRARIATWLKLYAPLLFLMCGCCCILLLVCGILGTQSATSEEAAQALTSNTRTGATITQLHEDLLMALRAGEECRAVKDAYVGMGLVALKVGNDSDLVLLDPRATAAQGAEQVMVRHESPFCVGGTAMALFHTRVDVSFKQIVATDPLVYHVKKLTLGGDGGDGSHQTRAAAFCVQKMQWSLRPEMPSHLTCL